MSKIINETVAAAQEVRAATGQYQAHIKQIEAFKEEGEQLKTQVKNFLEKTTLPTDEALNLTITKEAKMNWLRSKALIMERDIEKQLQSVGTLAEKTLTLLVKAMAEESDLLLKKVALLIKPYAPDYRHPLNEELLTPSIDIAAGCPIFGWFDTQRLFIRRSAFTESYSRMDGDDTSKAAKWDSEMLDYVNQILAVFDVWNDNSNSFVPKNFGK